MSFFSLNAFSHTTCRCTFFSVFPNGSLGIAALVLAICGYLLGVFANNSCFFASVDLQDATGLDFSGSQNFGFGLWTRENATQDYCEIYTSNEENLFVDASWIAARFMAVIANICGGITMIVAICLSCVSIPQLFLKCTAVLSFSAGLFECLTFVFFSSDACATFNCQFDRGAGFAVGASVVYMLNTCILLKIPPYQGRGDDQFVPPASNDPPPGSVQVTVTDLPDGTKKTTRTVVNADGSRTVTETIERPAAPVATATTIPSGAAEPAKAY